MENQKEMVEFIKWIATNVKGFEKSTPEEIVTAINGMAQSEEGKKSLQELYTQFQASKKKFQFGGIIPRMQGGGDTLRYMTLRPIVTTRNGYPEQVGEDRTISRRYSTYSPGTAPARREFYTEDGYARRINGNDTIWLKRRPIAYTPAGNPENKEDANYVHIWEEVMPTSWLRTMFNSEPDSVEGPEVVESQQNGGRILGVTHSGWRNGRNILVPGQTHEYFDSYTVEGPSDDRIEAIVQTEYPNRHILRIKDRPDSKPIFMGDKFHAFGLLNQDSLSNVWDSLRNLKTTYPNIGNKKW